MGVRTISFVGGLAAVVAALINPARGQTSLPGKSSPPAVTVYVQVSDARFNSYLQVQRSISATNETDGFDEFFYIPRGNSKEREKELADWRRKFNLIVSAATLSERVQPKISRVKDAFGRADSAAECWTVDNNKERRITVTIIGSASETAIEKEYQAASRDFLADPKNFTCKYAYKVGPSAPTP